MSESIAETILYQDELAKENISTDKMSDCCSAAVYAPTDDWAICMDCKENCGIFNEIGFLEENGYLDKE